MRLATGLDSFRHTGGDQCVCGSQWHSNRSREAVGDPGDLGCRAVFVDE